MVISSGDSGINIEELLEEIENILEEGTSLAFVGKTVVDAKKIRTTLEDIRLNMPEVIRRAQEIAADRANILERARIESDTTVKNAKKYANDKVSETNTKVADHFAKCDKAVKSMIESANNEAARIIRDAEDKAADILDRDELTVQARNIAAQIKRSAEERADALIVEAERKAGEEIAKAQKWSTDIRTAASEFIEDLILTTENSLVTGLNEVRRAKDGLKSAINNINNS